MAWKVGMTVEKWYTDEMVLDKMAQTKGYG